jgi:hypothetical protein
MEYASISDAWGDSFCPKDKPKKTKTNKTYDNIIDSYIDDFDQSKKINVKKYKQVCNNEVQPFSNQQHYMGYDDYFSTSNLFLQEEVKCPVVKEEQSVYDNDNDDASSTSSSNVNEEVVEEEGYYCKPVKTYSEERYSNNKKYMYKETYENKKSYQYLDFILYIISGVFLIFMFEQILKIGIEMKS